MIKKTTTLIAFTFAICALTAQIFEDNGIIYNIISVNPNEVEVISNIPEYEGDIFIYPCLTNAVAIALRYFITEASAKLGLFQGAADLHQ